MSLLYAAEGCPGRDEGGGANTGKVRRGRPDSGLQWSRGTPWCTQEPTLLVAG